MRLLRIVALTDEMGAGEMVGYGRSGSNTVDLRNPHRPRDTARALPSTLRCGRYARATPRGRIGAIRQRMYATNVAIANSTTVVMAELTSPRIR